MGIHIMVPLFMMVKPPPGYGEEQETTYPCLPYDGYLPTARGHPYLTYPLNWNAASTGVYDYEGALSLYNHTYRNTASIYRGVLFFDTTTLPENALIISAKVRNTVLGIMDCRGASLALTPATNVHTPLIATDYAALITTPQIIGQYPLADMSEQETIFIPLTDEGLLHITKGGITRFGARIDYETAADPCSTCYEGVRIICCEGPGITPALIVKYKLPI